MRDNSKTQTGFGSVRHLEAYQYRFFSLTLFLHITLTKTKKKEQTQNEFLQSSLISMSKRVFI